MSRYLVRELGDGVSKILGFKAPISGLDLHRYEMDKKLTNALTQPFVDKKEYGKQAEGLYMVIFNLIKKKRPNKKLFCVKHIFRLKMFTLN